MHTTINKLKAQKSEQGFTIIEIMIVLAIVGLIILVVLLAVPALQRNGRNTTLKADASALAGGITEFASNNDGAIPTTGGSSQAGGTVTINNASGTAGTAKVQGSTVVNFESTATPTAAKFGLGNIDVDYGYKCTSSAGSAVTVSPRATAIIYSLETAGGTNARCLDT